VFAITLNWPKNNLLHLASVDSANVDSIEVLGSEETPEWAPLEPTGISVKMPPLETATSKWAWTIVINTLAS